MREPVEKMFLKRLCGICLCFSSVGWHLHLFFSPCPVTRPSPPHFYGPLCPIFVHHPSISALFLFLTRLLLFFSCSPLSLFLLSDKAPGQRECDSSIDNINKCIRDIEQASLAAVSQNLPSRDDISLEVNSHQTDTFSTDVHLCDALFAFVCRRLIVYLRAAPFVCSLLDLFSNYFSFMSFCCCHCLLLINSRCAFDAVYECLI